MLHVYCGITCNLLFPCQIVYESVICGEYLDEQYPEKPLLPRDPYQRARVRILIDAFSKVLHLIRWSLTIMIKLCCSVIGAVEGIHSIHAFHANV